jgi:hypothetical protein
MDTWVKSEPPNEESVTEDEPWLERSEPSDKEDISSNNPWAVDTIEEFHFYCCPECDERYHSAKQFKEHASYKHPKV